MLPLPSWEYWKNKRFPFFIIAVLRRFLDGWWEAGQDGTHGTSQSHGVGQAGRGGPGGSGSFCPDRPVRAEDDQEQQAISGRVFCRCGRDDGAEGVGGQALVPDIGFPASPQLREPARPVGQGRLRHGGFRPGRAPPGRTGEGKLPGRVRNLEEEAGGGPEGDLRAHQGHE